MGSVNTGTQINTFCYENAASSASFNTILHNLISEGIYKGGILTRISDVLCSLAPTVVVISDPAENVTIRCQTTTNATLAISEESNYIIMRLTWLNQVNNYVDIIPVSESYLLAKDIVLARGVYSSGVLVSFDYSVKTLNIFDTLTNAIADNTDALNTAIINLNNSINSKYPSSSMTQVGGSGTYGNKGILTSDLGFLPVSFIAFAQNASDLGLSNAGSSNLVARENHVHDVCVPFTTIGNVSADYEIKLNVKESVTLTATTTFTLATINFRVNKENWFDITIYNDLNKLVYFPSTWKWINNVSSPIGTLRFNLIGWCSDGINWNVGYTVLGT